MKADLLIIQLYPMTMKKKTMCHILKIVVLMLCFCTLTACDNDDDGLTETELKEQTNLIKWKAGSEVSEKSIERYGIENCFASTLIDDSIFKRIYGKSFKEYCTIPRDSLRYVKVLHYTKEGKIHIGEVMCNVSIATDLVNIFRELYNSKYPIEKILLVDDYNANDDLSMEDNNSSCFNFRFMTGSTKLSNHAKGKAIDINTLYNPYVKMRADSTLYVEPSNALPYVDRSKDFAYKIDHNDLCYKVFIKHGFKWGGDWISLKDYQHFEKE